MFNICPRDSLCSAFAGKFASSRLTGNRLVLLSALRTILSRIIFHRFVMQMTGAARLSRCSGGNYTPWFIKLISYLDHRTGDSPKELTQRRKNVPRIFTSNELREKRDPAGKHTELRTKKKLACVDNLLYQHFRGIVFHAHWPSI